MTALDLAGVATPCFVAPPPPLRGRLLPPAARGDAAAPSSPQAALPGRQLPPGPPRRPRWRWRRREQRKKEEEKKEGEEGGEGEARASSGSGSRTTRSGGCRRSCRSSPARSGTCPSRSTPWPGTRAPGRPGVAEELGDAGPVRVRAGGGARGDRGADVRSFF